MSKSQSFLDRFDFRESYLASRPIKAKKILRVLERELGDTSQLTLLDIGCGQGGITEVVARPFAFVVGLDPEPPGAKETHALKFVQGNGCRLPFRDGSFDVILLNHVLEHVLSPTTLLDEVWRVMKPTGICYLACPNRLIQIEPHYRLLLLSWLPRPWADCYVRWRGRGENYLDALPSFWRLKRMTARFQILDMALPLLKRPGDYFPDDHKLRGHVRWVQWMPTRILRLLLPFVPVFVWILRKEHGPSLR